MTDTPPENVLAPIPLPAPPPPSPMLRDPNVRVASPPFAPFFPAPIAMLPPPIVSTSGIVHETLGMLTCMYGGVSKQTPYASATTTTQMLTTIQNASLREEKRRMDNMTILDYLQNLSLSSHDDDDAATTKGDDKNKNAS